MYSRRADPIVFASCIVELSAFLPQSIDAEIASVVLMFTSQVWNLTSAWLRRTCEAAVRLISQVAPSLVPCKHAGVHGILGHAGRHRFRTLNAFNKYADLTVE